MTSERKRAGQFLHAEMVCPVRDMFDRNAKLTEDVLRPPHFGNLARFMDVGLDLFFERHLAAPQFIGSTKSVDGLDRSITKLLQITFGRLYDNPELKNEVDYLRESQKMRVLHGEAPWDTLEESISDGTLSSVIAMRLIYDKLIELYTPQLASSPDNWSLVNDVGRLNIYQSTAFTQHILYGSPQLFEDLIELVDNDNEIYAKFTGELPDIAFVPEPYKDDVDPVLNPESDLLIPLKDVGEHLPSIGCPITLVPKQVRRLWSLYGEQRARIRSVHTMSRGASAFIKQP